MENEIEKMQESLVLIASELFRFRRAFENAINKLDLSEQKKHTGYFSWFTKQVEKALNDSGLKTISHELEMYDPGMAVTPLNIGEFEPEDSLIVAQMIEPIIMKNDELIKMGTVMLGRVEK